MKNFYFNLNQLPSKNDGGQSCDGNRQSSLMLQSGCGAVDVPMTSYGAPDEHPMSIRSASDGERWQNRVWKYVAMIFAVLVMSVGQMWGETYTWSFANGSGTIAKTTTNFTSTSGSKTLIYDGGDGCAFDGDSGNKYLKMGGKSSYSAEIPSDRFFKFLAPSSSGTVSISYAGTVSNTEISAGSNGSLVWDVITPTADETSTSKIISGLTAGSTYVYISCPADKSYIKSITWTDAALPYERVYYSEMKTCDWGTALESGASFTAHNSAIGLNGKGGSGWNSYFSNYLNISSSGGYATVSFSPALSLVSNESDKGRIRIYYSTTQANKNLSLEMNGSSAGTYNALLQYRTYVAEYTIPDATTNVSSIKMSQSGSGGIVIFAIEVLTYSSSTWYLPGSWYKNFERANNVKFTGSPLTLTLHLDEHTSYDFKLVKNNGSETWYDNSGGKVITTMRDWSIAGTSGGNNSVLFTGPEGDYTFTLDPGNQTLDIDYPNIHPDDNYMYFENTNVWGTVGAYIYSNDSWKVTSWEGTPSLANSTVEICGHTYHYCVAPRYSDDKTFENVIFRNLANSGQSSPRSAKKEYHGGKWSDNNSATIHEFNLYTISFAGNENTGGTMDAITGICPNSNLEITANAFEKTGYTFNCWHADKAVKVGGNTIAAGGDIAGGATLQEINNDITLTAQWTCIDFTPGRGGTSDGTYTVGDDGGTLTCSVAAAGSYTYQWKQYTSGQTPSAAVDAVGTGATSTSFTPHPTVAGTYYYFCAVTNGCGTTKDCATSGTFTFNAAVTTHTVTYNANGGSCGTSSETAASVTLPTPTWSGYTFEGWYNAGTRIGGAGASYSPEEDITLYAHWTDNISGKVFSYIDGLYGDKYKAFDLSGWVTGEGSDKDKTYTNGTTGVQFVVDDGAWDNKTNKTASAISSMVKFVENKTTASIVIPDGKTATVKILYGSYSKNDKKLTVGGTAQNGPKASFDDAHTNAALLSSDMQEITLTDQTGTITLGSSSGNIYIARVSAVITSNATISATKTSPDYVTTAPGNVQLNISVTGASTGWYYRVKNIGKNGYETPDKVTYTTTSWTMTSGLSLGVNNFVVELYNGSDVLQASSSTITVTAETAYPMTIVAGANGSVSPSSVNANETANHIHPEITATPASGYHFVNWTLSNENATLENANAATTTITNASGACTITANFAADVVGHTVTYNYNGADGGNGTPSATGASVTLPTPTKDGYAFQGWYTSGGTKAGNGGDTYNPAANITLYALWRESCAGGSGNKTLVDINFKDASWSGKTFSQGNTTNEDLINGVYFYANNSNASKQFSLADNTTKGLTFPNNNMSSGNYYFCIPITGINSSDKQITVTLKHGYSSAKATYKYVYIDGRTSFEDGNTGGSSGTGVTDAANADTEISFTKSSLGNTSGHLIIGRGGSDFTQIYGVMVTTPNNATCYYVTYNGNGADGGFMTDETAHGSGDNVAILANTYTREGYTFTGWKTAPSSGTSYSPEGTITAISSDITLYAQWSEGTRYAVTYNGNGATSGSVPVDASSPYASGANVTVLDNSGSLALDNYTFDGWATANDGTGTSYAADGTISGISADVELFAKWKQTVTLNTGSQGSEEEKTPYIYINGAALNGFSAHTATGYTLNGYYTAASGGTKVLEANGSFAATDVANYVTDGKWSRMDATTLYAQWRAAAGSTCYEWDATETAAETGTNSYDGLYLTASNTTSHQLNNSSATAYTCFDVSKATKVLTGHLNGTEIASVKFAASTSDAGNNTFIIAFCSSYPFDTENIIQVGGYDCTVKDVNKYDAAKTEFTVDAPSGTKSFALGRNLGSGITASATLENSGSRYLYYLYVCSASGGTHTISYNNGGGTGTMTSDADIEDDGTKTLKTNTFTAPTNYSFAGWVADVAVTIGGDVKAAGTLIANGATITNITTDIALTAKWSQTITLDANTANNGSGDNTSATAMYNATSLASITHTTAASGYKLTGYYTAATDGTKVLNSDGTFASSNVADYITDGKWICVASTRTLYAQYEAAGALIWNLGVNTDATSLTTSSKTSAFTQIAVANMSNATKAEGVTYTKDKKTNLTGLISTPASYDADKYVYVTFQVASGYKFTPSSVKVKAQPASTAKSVKLVLSDANSNSQEFTTASTLSAGNIHDVIMTGDGTAYTGTVTLKIYCYGATDSYRLGTPIQIDGEVEETCATMPSFTQMNYSTTTFAPNADASGSPITIIGGENINTYKWKYNTTNDRTSGTDCGTNSPSLVPLTDVASGTTRYYWCEMTNNECHITIKSPAVAITVVAAKSDATVSWTGTTASANYGGGGYTVTATVSPAGWDGTLTEDMLTAMDGVVLSNINVTNDGKTITADFGVTEGANAEATNVAFYLNHPATTGYNAIDETYNTTTLNTLCIGAGGGDGTSYDVRVRKNTTTILQGKSTVVYGWDTPTKGFVTQSTGGSVTSTKSGYDDEPVFDTISKGNAKAYWVKSYVANVKKIKVYGQVGDDDLTATGVYHVGSFVAGGSSTAVAYTVVYEDEVDALKKGNHWFEITLDEAISTNDIIYFTVNKNFKIMGVRLTTVGAGGAILETALSAWSPAIDTRKEVNEDAASFVETVTKTGVNANTMGAITYSSGDETIATVDNRTGRVTIANNITWGDAITYKDVTITASLAPSGCYQGKTATYTLRVKKLTCTEAAGTITASSEGSHVVIEGDEVKKCTSETVTLTLGGYEEGATSFQWYKDGVLQDDKTTASITTGDAGVWYAVSNKGCAVTSTNEITITNRSTSAHVTRLAKEWYIKNGRLTPDIALWQLGDDCSFVSVAASGSWDTNTGLTAASSFYEEGGIVYLKGTEPNTNTGDQQNYTLTLTVNDGCGNQTLDDEGKIITIHHQQNTDKHVLAFVVRGTEKGGWTDGVTADQTTNVGLYNAIAENFDVIATNSWSTDDEQKLKEYYSQFDILCITDYPDTKKDKGANKKSTVDALGALVDIRPILTMEAWVSGLDNWRAKGISGNPKSPKTRQYTMLLQCKDHEIFAGTELTQVGTGDEAMFRISMVDNTKEDYATLDATYGGGTHAEKEGYQYGKKPALQGFTYTQEMSNNDLLPLGLIDDGSGNDLQVGIERQAVMEARLMVLGINSYAMERLDKDGETVVINALNYLLKKNAEDIADCSISFVGGAEGDAKNWHNVANWTGNTLPTKSQKVRILADCELNEPAHVAGVTIVNGGKYNHGNDDAKGKLTIMPNGALVVTGKVQEAKAPAYNKPYATSPEHLIINTSETAQAALIFNNDEGLTKATVNYYSLGRKIGSAYQFQYFAIPFEYLSVSPTFANVTHSTTIYTFVWHEASGWERRGYYSDLYAFEGVGITTASTSAITYEMKGTLASTAEREITLTKDNDGENIIGNSWMAPIDIASLKNAIGDDNNVEKVVYIYITGNDNGTGSSSSSETAGKWLAIPIDASDWRDWTGQKVIPAMQAYYIKANAETTLTLNYDSLVRSTAVERLNVPLKAPRRAMNNDGISLLTLRLENSKEHTDLYLFEGERFSDGYDNGWEAKQMADEGVMQFYAMNGEDKMAVLATDELEGTPVCFTPGNESNYTISFFGGDGRYYLNDLKEEQSTAIEQGNTYSFTYEQGDMPHRFLISTTPFGIPSVTTGIGGVEAQEKVQKVIYNDHVYIIRGGKIYDVMGKMMK